MQAHPLETVETVRAFALAGNATLTLRSKRTGTRFTFKLRQPEPEKPHFVSLLTGTDNEGDFTYVGMIRPQDGDFMLTRGSKLVHDAPAVVAFRWFWKAMRAGVMPETLEVWHEGRCGRCGRKLTVPESILTGFGPECIKRRGNEVNND
jgi:hypothetical protein